MIVIRVTKPELKGLGYLLAKEEIKNILGEVDAMLEYGEVGDSLLLEVAEISEEDFAKLGEFAGW